MIQEDLGTPDGYLAFDTTLAPFRRGAIDQTMWLLPDRCIRAINTPEGPATLEIRNEGTIRCMAWGIGSGWAIERAGSLVGMDDRPDAFSPEDPVMRALVRRSRGVRLGACNLITETLVPTIIEQKVTGKQARSSYAALVARYGNRAPGPHGEQGLRCPPHPDVIAGLSYFDLHPLGIERKRAATLIASCAQHARLQALVTAPRAQARARLEAITGIGPWTIAETMRLATGDPDAVSVGDYHLPNLVAWVLTGEPRGDDARMLQLLEPYRGQRARAVRMIELSGTRAPAFGPRAPSRSIASI